MEDGAGIPSKIPDKILSKARNRVAFISCMSKEEVTYGVH